jgi:hypothetical protein
MVNKSLTALAFHLGEAGDTDVYITAESRRHRSSFILRVEYIPQAIDHLAVLRNGHIDGGPSLSIG